MFVHPTAVRLGGRTRFLTALGVLVLLAAWAGCEKKSERPQTKQENAEQASAPAKDKAQASAMKTPSLPVAPPSLEASKLADPSMLSKTEPPPPLGIEACDQYAKKACNCANPAELPKMCHVAWVSFSSWRYALREERATREEIIAFCKKSEASLSAFCKTTEGARKAAASKKNKTGAKPKGKP